MGRYNNSHKLREVVCNMSGRKVKFTIPGEPVAQGRPRSSTRGGFARAYDPKKSKDAKGVIRMYAEDAMIGQEPLSGPIAMVVKFGIALPKSQYRKRKPVQKTWRVKKPDLDNLVKLVKDACSGVVFLDDNIIVRTVAEKIQCGQNEPPFTNVLFREVEEIISLEE